MLAVGDRFEGWASRVTRLHSLGAHSHSGLMNSRCVEHGLHGCEQWPDGREGYLFCELSLSHLIPLGTYLLGLLVRLVQACGALRIKSRFFLMASTVLSPPDSRPS